MAITTYKDILAMHMEAVERVSEYSEMLAKPAAKDTDLLAELRRKELKEARLAFDAAEQAREETLQFMAHEAAREKAALGRLEKEVNELEAAIPRKTGAAPAKATGRKKK